VGITAGEVGLDFTPRQWFFFKVPRGAGVAWSGARKGLEIPVVNPSCHNFGALLPGRERAL
jgi:hypothetical protein